MVDVTDGTERRQGRERDSERHRQECTRDDRGQDTDQPVDHGGGGTGTEGPEHFEILLVGTQHPRDRQAPMATAANAAMAPNTPNAMDSGLTARSTLVSAIEVRLKLASLPLGSKWRRLSWSAGMAVP